MTTRKTMIASFRAALLALSATAAVSAQALAAELEKYDASRQIASNAPVKKCTRINGRMGYYGNPWCTPAEQARWDRWDARRTQRK
jgi:hypothetical protein